MAIASKIRSMQGVNGLIGSNGQRIFKEGEDKLASLFSSWIDLQISVNGK